MSKGKSISDPARTTSADATEERGRFIRAVYRGLLLREPDDGGFRHWTEALSHLRPAEVLESFLASEEFKKRAERKLFVPDGHYYSPIVDPQEAEEHLQRLSATPVECLSGVNLDRTQLVAMWHVLLPFMQDIPFRGKPGGSFRYGFDNPAYSWADGMILHAILRRFRPSRFIEVGSGWSSGCTIDTVETYLAGACDLMFIEPHPEVLGRVLSARPTKAKLEVVVRRVQAVPVSVFESLQAGDILFIDSSHILRTGSDVCYELFDVLPNLRSGVIVHFHDIFWPFEYPWDWVVEERRSWNEIYAIRAFLTNNTDWTIIMFNDYMAKFENSLIVRTNPRFLRNSGGALWLQRR